VEVAASDDGGGSGGGHGGGGDNISSRRCSRRGGYDNLRLCVCVFDWWGFEFLIIYEIFNYDF